MKERVRQEEEISTATLVWNQNILPHWDNMYVCVCVCVCTCVRACVCACICVRACAARAQSCIRGAIFMSVVMS